ncbi:MAG: TadE/TadG family type IV pilus assembly protein [Bryobacteraceae bacterium]
MRRATNSCRRGNAFIEFALAAGILLPVMMGTFQFGYTFYTYNVLESAVSNGGRYAAYRTYRSLSGQTDVNKFRLAVQNMTVYGSPAPAASPVPVVKGLKPSDIEVLFTLTATQIPTTVTVRVRSFTVDGLFGKFTFKGYPTVTMPYLGRYAPEESEP